MAAARKRRAKGGRRRSFATDAPEDRVPPKDTTEFEGVVVEQMRNASFRVELPNGHVVLARVAGKMRKFRIRVMPGDHVTVAMSLYDTSMGRITFRHRT